jgi:hypothetical protein
MNRTRIGIIAAATTIGAIALLSAAPANATVAVSVPEPATLSLLALGIAGLAIGRRRK